MSIRVVVADGFRSPVGVALSLRGDWATSSGLGSNSAYRLRLPRSRAGRQGGDRLSC